MDSVDSSKKAMDMVDRNVALNGFGPDVHTSYCTDAIDFVKNVPDGAYDLMIVDPPAFAKHRGALKNALRAYQRLNAAAIAKVAPGGFVFTCSRSAARRWWTRKPLHWPYSRPPQKAAAAFASWTA